MRELVFKNLTSDNKKRKDFYISEVIEQDGIKTSTQRHSIYIIGGHNKFNDIKETLEWQKAHPMDTNKRHIFIFKKRDTKLKKDTFVCDVVGKFYAIVKNEAYSIAFKHSFEIDFLFEKEYEKEY